MKNTKYHAISAKIDGYKFDSQMEAAYYLALKQRQKRGEIQEIQPHPVYWVLEPFEHMGERIRGIRFTPDFKVIMADGSCEIHEVKSAATRQARDYSLRKKLFLKQNPTIKYVEIL